MTTLQQSLINARKVMNKVDGGDFSKGNVQLSQSNISDSSGLISEVQAPPLPNINTGGGKQDLSPKSHITEEHIKNSRLPDAIKKAMIESPIPDIPFNGGGAGLSEEFLSGVKTQMDKQGIPYTVTLMLLIQYLSLLYKNTLHPQQKSQKPKNFLLRP